MRNKKGKFKKGHTYVMSNEHKRKIGLANKGERHGLWAGNKISYRALHVWVARNYGKPATCEECGKSKKLVWANLSGEYRRDRDDWKRLCRKCHYKFDFGMRGNPNAKLTQEDIKIIKDTPKIYGSGKKLAKKFGVNRLTIARYR